MRPGVMMWTGAILGVIVIAANIIFGTDLTLSAFVAGALFGIGYGLSRPEDKL